LGAGGEGKPNETGSYPEASANAPINSSGKDPQRREGGQAATVPPPLPDNGTWNVTPSISSRPDAGRSDTAWQSTEELPRASGTRTGWAYCPYCARSIPRGSVRCPHCREDFYDHDDHPLIGQEGEPWHGTGVRRDCEPHRGQVILSLGVLSVVMTLGSCLVFPPVLGLGLGVCAWVMGQTDMPKIRRGEMDPREPGMTSAGWILGIIGTIVNGMISTCWGLIFLAGIMQP
jgi:hypothetical protein